MATASRPIEIHELIEPLGLAHRWRVDWLGNVHKPRLHHVQHTISVFFSPLYPDYRGVVTAPEATDPTRQVAIELGVGYLPVLYIGAVFYKGRPVPLLPSQTNRIRCKISPEHFRHVPMNGHVDRLTSKQAQPVVMPWEFKVGSKAYAQAATSENLIISDAARTDPSFIAIPSIEVVRFFFCTSSLLSRHLFSSGWDDLILWSQCNTQNMPREVVVGLRNVSGLNWNYAPHLAYAVKDPQTHHMVDPLTRQCLHSVHQTLQSTGSDRFRQPAIKCRLPISETVEIEAEVIQTSANTEQGARFFVTRLLKVPRPIPFEQCSVWPQLHPQRGDNWNDPELMPMRLPKGNKSPPEGQDYKPPFITNPEELAEAAQASDDLGRPMKSSTTVDFSLDESRFPGLNSVPTSLANKDRQKYRNLGADTSRRPIEGERTSTAEPGGSRHVAPANLDTNPIWFEDEGLRMLVESIPFLEEYGYKVSQLPTVHLNRFAISAEQRKSRWARIQIATDKERGRSYRSKLLLALLVTSMRGACLIGEIERDPQKTSHPEDSRHFLAGFLLQRPDTAISELEAIASNVVQRRAWPKYDAGTRRFKLHDKTVLGERAKHQNIATAKELADRIYGSILANLNI